MPTSKRELLVGIMFALTRTLKQQIILPASYGCLSDGAADLAWPEVPCMKDVVRLRDLNVMMYRVNCEV